MMVSKNKFQLSDSMLDFISNSSKLYVTIMNGVFSAELSRLPENILIYNRDALSDKNITASFGSIDGKEAVALDPNSGAVLIVTERSVLLDPVYINYINTEKDRAQEVSNTIIIKTGAKINFVEQFLFSKQPQSSQKNTFRSEWLLEEDSQLTHFSFRREGLGEKSIINNELFVRQNKNSHSSFMHIYWDPGLIKNKIHVTLNQPNSACSLFSFSLLNGVAGVDNDIFMRHIAPNCESSQFYKGVFDEHSKGVFNSTVFVDRGAQKSSTLQKNNNILLSDYASIDSNPQLEIFADDVKCAHGATMGQIDSDALFYFRSRGVGESVAKKILLQAFFDDIINKISDGVLKKLVLLTLSKKLDLVKFSN